MHTYEMNPAGTTDIGNVRSVNEDHLLADGDLFAVADGMGGLGHGQVASRTAIQSLHQAFLDDPTTDGLAAAVQAANRAVCERAEAEPAGPTDRGGSTDQAAGQTTDRTMGTTIAAVALVTEDGVDRLAVANVGDSRVYLLHNQQLRCLSSDHSRVAELVRAGELTEEEASGHPERHILTQALGIGPDIEPHMASVEPSAGDRVMLCSDGLFNELTTGEISELLTTIVDPSEAADRLVAAANERGGNDNITVVIVDIA